MTCDFQQCCILICIDSDEPVQPLCKLRNSKRCSVSSLTLIEYSSDSQRLWSDCAYTHTQCKQQQTMNYKHNNHCLRTDSSLGHWGLVKKNYAQTIGILHTQLASKCDQETSQLHSAYQPGLWKVPSHNNYQVTLNVYGGQQSNTQWSECWMQSERYVSMIKKKTITHCRQTHATVRQSDRTLT